MLTDAQRQRLRQFLPQFPDNCTSQQDAVISDLFNNQNFRFGNPLHLAQKLFRGRLEAPLPLAFLKILVPLTDLVELTASPCLSTDGYFNPEVVKYRQLCAKSQRKRHLYSLQQYYHRLLKHILVSRKVRTLTCQSLMNARSPRSPSSI